MCIVRFGTFGQISKVEVMVIMVNYPIPSNRVTCTLPSSSQPSTLWNLNSCTLWTLQPTCFLHVV